MFKRKSQTKPKITTVNDILVDENINSVLAEIKEKAPDIKSMLVIYIDKDDESTYLLTDGMKVSTAVYLLEATKLSIMEDASEGE